MAEKKNTTELVRQLALPLAESLGLELWDVRFQKEGTNLYLRIFIDKPGGVSLDDCVDMSHALDAPLDELDPINESYSLQVSSPGLERELVRDEHFLKYLGSNVFLRLLRPRDGRREFKGILSGYDSGEITVTLDDSSELKFTKKEASYVKLDDFNDFEELISQYEDDE